MSPNAVSTQAQYQEKISNDLVKSSSISSSGDVATVPNSNVASRKTPPTAFLEMGYTIEQWQTLTQHLFPNARSIDSIWMVTKICKAKGLDPLARPYHIVPMYDTKSQDYIDTIWPGIGLYDIQASRSGSYAGKDPAQYGPLKKFPFSPSDIGRQKGERKS